MLGNLRPQFPHSGSVACSLRHQLGTPRPDDDRLEEARGTSPLRPHFDGFLHGRIRFLMQDHLLRMRTRSWRVPIAKMRDFMAECFM